MELGNLPNTYFRSPNEDAAKADLQVVRNLYTDDVLRTDDAAFIAKEPDGREHIRRQEEPTRHAAWAGAVGALAGILFPPGIIVGAALGAAIGGLIGHLCVECLARA